jgi:hypothetical protein
MLEVFTFMSDMENHVQEEDSNVLLVEKTTHGPVDVGALYREVVQMFPLIHVNMISEVTRYEPNECIEFVWKGGGMEGVLRYNVESHNGGTRLRLHETITPRGIMILFEPLIKRMFQSTLENRLNGIKRVLELSIEDPGG